MTRVLIADDHPVIVEGLKEILIEAGFEVVGEANNLDSLQKLVQDPGADVLILDVRFQDGDGLEVLQRLKAEYPRIGVLMYSANDNPKFISKAIAGGAAGYLLKGTPMETLIQCVRTAATGGSCWTREEVRRTSVALAAPRIAEDVDAPLTQREAEVLRQLVLGRTNKQIAQELNISYETVKEHVQHLLEKIGVCDRTQAAVWAVRSGIV